MTRSSSVCYVIYVIPAPSLILDSCVISKANFQFGVPGNTITNPRVSLFIVLLRLIVILWLIVQAKRKRARTPTPGEYLGVRGAQIITFFDFVGCLATVVSLPNSDVKSQVHSLLQLFVTSLVAVLLATSCICRVECAVGR